MSTKPRRAPGKGAQLLAPVAVMAVVLLMIVPLPAMLLDLLLSIDIGLAVTLMLTSIYVTEPIQFSVFPSLLLVLTWFVIASPPLLPTSSALPGAGSSRGRRASPS